MMERCLYCNMQLSNPFRVGKSKEAFCSNKCFQKHTNMKYIEEQLYSERNRLSRALIKELGRFNERYGGD